MGLYKSLHLFAVHFTITLFIISVVFDFWAEIKINLIFSGNTFNKISYRLKFLIRNISIS